MHRIAGAVLAAGAGLRMGGPKAELVVDGRRLLDRAVATLIDGGCDPVCAVLRPDTRPPADPAATALRNPEPDSGMRSSLETAVAWAAAGKVDALAVLLADLPGVDAAAVAAVLAGWQPGRIALAAYGERSGHPIVMSPRLWTDALAVAGPDEGARRFLAAQADRIDAVRLDDDSFALVDLDEPEDLRRWSGRRR